MTSLERLCLRRSIESMDLDNDQFIEYLRAKYPDTTLSVAAASEALGCVPSELTREQITLAKDIIWGCDRD